MRTITLNIIHGYSNAVLKVSQYDKGYDVTATIRKGVEDYTIPTDYTVTVEGRKPDGTGYQYPATFDGNTVTFAVMEQMTVLSGRSIAEVVFYDAEAVRVGTANFAILVEPAPLNGDVPISETELPLLQQAITAAAEAQASASSAAASANTATQAASSAETSADSAETSADSAETSADSAETSAESAGTSAESAEGSAEDSEAWAVGQRNGTDVTEDDPTYHNNSKYYAEQSAESATAAEDNATAAAASATNAQTSATSAANSATSANNAKDNAEAAASQAEEIVSSIVDATLSVSGKAADAKVTGDEITGLKNDLDGVSDSVKSLTGEKENPATNWEIGNISVNAASGYTYNSSGRRLRTKKGISYHLKQGNTVTIKNEVELTKTDQTKETVQLQFWVSWYNTTTGRYEWRHYDSSEFTAPIESDYVFIIHVTGESNYLTIYTDAISVMSSALSIFGDGIILKMEHGFEMSNFDSDGATKLVCRMGWDIYNSTTPPQGSVASFKEAYKHGFRIMLADIFATADNKLVIAHDDNISLIGAKNSDGTAISGTVNITESTLAQLDVYDFGIYKGSDYAGYKIPRLEDFLRFCKKYNCKIIFEMKDRSLTDEELQVFVSMINKYGLMDSVTSVGYIRATDSEKFGLLFPNTPLWYDIGTLTEANINYVYNNRPSTGNYQWIYMLVNNTHPVSDAITQLTEFGEYVKSKGMGLGITELSATSELTALETGGVLSMLDYIAITDLSTYVNFLYD